MTIHSENARVAQESAYEKINEAYKSDGLAAAHAVAGAFIADFNAINQPIDLRAQVRAYIARNGCAKVTDDDPLTVEKVMVARYLKKLGRSEADLPKGFWSLSREERGYLLGQIVGEVRTEERQARRAKRMTERGYPSDYRERPADERVRISNNVRQRRRRGAPSREAIPLTPVSRDWIADRFTRLKNWTHDKSNGPVARQLRGREREYVKASAIFYTLAFSLGGKPSQSELAEALGCSRSAAQNRMEKLAELEGAGGPWHLKT